MNREEPINIISKTYQKNKFMGGPGKVITNTIKGFQEIGQKFVLNQRIYDYRNNWIHDSIEGLIEVSIRKIPAVVGPNIVVLPKDLPFLMPSLSHCIYLHPSEWPKQMWYEWGFDQCPVFVWPAGIETEKFKLKSRPVKNENVLIYYKRRQPDLLNDVIKILEGLDFKCHILKYGKYAEKDFLSLLKKVSFCVWLGVSESQGIALMEALSSNVPIIVLNVKSLFEDVGRNSYKIPFRLKGFRPTSAPYFDQRCGYIIEEISELGPAIHRLHENWGDFNPRSYIEENHTLSISAVKLLDFFNQLPEEELIQEKLLDSFFCRIVQSEFNIRNSIRKLKNKL